MTSVTIVQLQAKIEKIVAFLRPQLGFVNCHMVNYLTDDLWTKHIPVDVRTEIENAQPDVQTVVDWFWTGVGNFPALRDYVDRTKTFWLSEDSTMYVKPSELRGIFNWSDCPQLAVPEFMSAKKNHEVEVTAALVARLAITATGAKRLVIDAGDGKGYLSSRIALEYEVPVLGIDANKTNTLGATKRADKLTKAWGGLQRRADTLARGETPEKSGKPKFRAAQQQQTTNSAPLLYKTATTFITPETDVLQIAISQFHSTDAPLPSECCLTGLHTCGNLAPTCLRLFTANTTIHTLCNIGCCYHLLNDNPTETSGFPMSRFLQSSVQLERNARMLASQSVQRTLAQPDRLSNTTLLYRAILEWLATQHGTNGQSLIVGRTKLKDTKFVDYVRRCSAKCNLNWDSLSDTYLGEIWKRFERDQCKLDIFYLVRMHYAPIVETLILLDRLLYLKENHFDRSYLVELFNPVMSPRCFGIVAIK